MKDEAILERDDDESGMWQENVANVLLFKKTNFIYFASSSFPLTGALNHPERCLPCAVA